MPLVAQADRRHFIMGAAATSTLACSYSLPAADNLDALKFVIVSDTHLGRKDSESAERNWRQAIAEINRLPGQFVLHLGDVVDGGRAEQYPIYNATRKLLNKPIHEIPGNHDPLDLFRQHVTQTIDRHVDYNQVRFVLFNNAHQDSHDGFITDKQVAWLTQQLSGAKKQQLKVVICCHVPIHSNRHPDRGWYVKPDHGQQAFYQLQQEYQETLLACMHGHFHNGIRGWRDHGRTVEVLLPSVCYNQNRNLTQHLASGQADGFFVDELRPGFVLAELGKGRLNLRYKPLGAETDAHYVANWS
ncbi:MAG TPA: hypothetical protein DCY79_17030 [Planctomycetaceae bacterium]|nr:hypothetical protein [Planctomycetaceae bacterium]